MRVGTSSKRSGFTIVELLIVVVVIAILAAITIVSYNGITNRAKDSAAQNTASQAAKKAAVFSVQNSDRYPDDKDAFFAASGLRDGNGVTYQYMQLGGGTGYCITIIKDSIPYYVSNTNATPTKGACAGHTGVPGGTVAVNLVPNPSLEVNSNGWTSSSSSLNPTRVQVSGKWVFQGVRTDTAAVSMRTVYGSPSTVVVGNTYTASMSVYSSAARTVNIAVRQAGTTTAMFSSDYVFTAGETKRISVTGVANTASAYVNFLSSSSGAAIGDTYYIDEVMLTEGSTVYPYADGDTAGWIWDGTPGNSTSRGPAL